MNAHAVMNATLVLHGLRGTLQVRVASSLYARALGLLPSRTLAIDQGLLIPHCNCIHTMAMAYPIDVLFVDARACLIGLHPGLPPWRIAGCPGACAVLELAAGGATAAGLECGDRLPELLPWLDAAPCGSRPE